MNPIRFAIAGLLASALFAACQSHDPQSIDTRPSFAMRYATERVSPAVVMLDVVSETFSGGQSTPVRGIGSGIIIDREGHVLTNFHVAGQASRIEATLATQEHVHAHLLGSDHWTDLAVVQLDMDEIRAKKLIFAVATLGSSAGVMLGQPAIAVGTPYGLSRTITAGIISQTERPLDEFNIDGYETGWFNNWIQTDAAINPGNSGGPLINLRGEVIGINTRTVSDANNLGFAIPIDTAKEIAAKILAGKKVTRSYIGVTLQPMQDLEGFFDVAGNKGVLVKYVEPDSPASKAGVQTADVLLAVNGTPVSARFPEQLAAVRKLISDFPVGAPVQLTLQRGGTRATIAAAATTSAPAVASTGRSTTLDVQMTTAKLESTKTPEKAIEAWGITVSDVTRAYLRTARLPAMQGVLVTSMRTGSPAERANMEYHDIIQRVNDKEVSTIEELEAAVEQWRKEKKQVLVDVSRNRGQVSLVLKP